MTFLTPASPPGEDLGSAPYGILKKPVNGRKMKDPAQDFGEDFFHPPNDKSPVSLVPVFVGAFGRNKFFSSAWFLIRDERLESSMLIKNSWNTDTVVAPAF